MLFELLARHTTNQKEKRASRIRFGNILFKVKKEEKIEEVSINQVDTFEICESNHVTASFPSLLELKEFYQEASFEV